MLLYNTARSNKLYSPYRGQYSKIYQNFHDWVFILYLNLYVYKIMYVLGAEEYIYNMLPFIWGNRDMTYIYTQTYTYLFIFARVYKKKH